jgi:hypothetical protein
LLETRYASNDHVMLVCDNLNTHTREAGMFGKLDVMITVGGWPAILEFVKEG